MHAQETHTLKVELALTIHGCTSTWRPMTFSAPVMVDPVTWNTTSVAWLGSSAEPAPGPVQRTTGRSRRHLQRRPGRVRR
jgi:hypothetical protein